MTHNRRRILAIAAVIVGVPIIALGWWLASPLFLDSEVDEQFPVAASPSTTTTATEPSGGPTTGPTTSTTADSAETVPVALARGDFRDADASHRGSGSATIFELEDGSRVLRFEDFEVTNGPDLHVYLVPAENTSGEVSVEGYVDLGELKGNIGAQNYELPPDIDPTAFNSVVIWCEPFRVVFSVATLAR